MAGTTVAEPTRGHIEEQPVPGPEDIHPVLHETRDRIITGAVTVIPIVALGVAGWLAWQHILHWTDVIIFVILYPLTGFGITVKDPKHFSTSDSPQIVGSDLSSGSDEGGRTAIMAPRNLSGKVRIKKP